LENFYFKAQSTITVATGWRPSLPPLVCQQPSIFSIGVNTQEWYAAWASSSGCQIDLSFFEEETIQPTHDQWIFPAKLTNGVASLGILQHSTFPPPPPKLSCNQHRNLDNTQPGDTQSLQEYPEILDDSVDLQRAIATSMQMGTACDLHYALGAPVSIHYLQQITRNGLPEMEENCLHHSTTMGYEKSIYKNLNQNQRKLILEKSLIMLCIST
uniref:Uncharacterized protein n=1 Tax=Romanomermis culicivorax TaxID=13658 RepID=A0A915JXM8_ROMCU